MNDTAKKDTQRALYNRGVSEETTALLLSQYKSLSAIAAAGEPALVELGLSEEEAASIISKLGKRASNVGTKAKKAVEDIAPAEPMEEVAHPLELNDEELKIEALAERESERNLGVDGKPIKLPLKIIIDIAARTAKADPGLSEEQYAKVMEVAYRMYVEHIMDLNESAGVMAAHSIGEPGTQMNMRTFHYAGVANINVTQGLPRLIEIVDARRVPSTPSMDIPLVGTAAEDEYVARAVASEIEMTTLLDVASIETDITNMRLIVNPDAQKMDEKRITLDDIADRLNRIKAVRGMVERGGDVASSNAKGRYDELGSRSEYVITITADEPSYKKLQVMYDAIKNAKIKGIDGITRAVLSKKEGSWKIVTEGSNLREVLLVEGVDKENVMTNSILEVADVLGIEAARNSIIHEAMGTLGEAGLDVDIRHIMLVADLMTNDGYVKAIGRHGVSGKKSSVLARAAFEITAAHLLHAAMVGEVDNLEGVTENIIVGQPVTLGTGAVNLIYTPKKKGDEE